MTDAFQTRLRGFIVDNGGSINGESVVQYLAEQISCAEPSVLLERIAEIQDEWFTAESEAFSVEVQKAIAARQEESVILRLNAEETRRIEAEAEAEHKKAEAESCDIKRYLTDYNYKEAWDSSDDVGMRMSSDYYEWLWDLDGAPSLQDQYFSVARLTNRPSGFKPAIMGEWLAEKRPMVIGTNGFLYGCGKVGTGLGLYQECEDWIRKMVQHSHGPWYTGNPSNQVVSWLVNELASSKVELTERLPGGLINVRNGMLDPLLDEHGVVVGHSCQFVSISQIPVNWNSGASCPLIDKFLAEVADSETVELIWEMIGYILFGNNERQKAFLLRGPGGNGKSVLLWILTRLVGGKYIQNSSLNDLCDNRFRAAGLYGKKANVCGDLGTKAVENVDMFKRLTGSDEVEVEHKGRDPFKFLNKAVLVFSANADPRLLDRTRAVEDRWVLISLPNTFRGTASENPNLFQELTSKDELEGALIKAIEGYRRLEKQNGFTIPAASAKLKRDFKASNSSAKAFFYECLEETEDEEDRIERALLHRVYMRWMEDNDPNAKRNSFKSKKFLLELESEMGPLDNGSNRIVKVNDKRLITGIQWSDEGQEYIKTPTFGDIMGDYLL